jgi:hypothetical protein
MIPAKDGKRTNMNFIALEHGPVELVVVELDQGPVPGEDIDVTLTLIGSTWTISPIMR